MTVIVGIIAGDSVFMGADHAATGGNYQSIRKHPKVFMKGEIGIAYTSSFRMGDILEYSWTPPVWRKDEMSLDEYMRTIFVDSVRDVFKEKGYGKANGDEGDEGGSFIVGIDGRLFSVLDNFQVAENDDSFVADGAGWGVASGALWAFEEIKAVYAPSEKLLIAMHAAAKFTPSVRRPFTIIEVLPYGKNKEKKDA